jgi:hypothetical protein
MLNLGLADFELDIRSYGSAFRYEITFRFMHTRKPYRGEGAAASPSQCFDAAMRYLADMMRESVTVPLYDEDDRIAD